MISKKNHNLPEKIDFPARKEDTFSEDSFSIIPIKQMCENKDSNSFRMIEKLKEDE